MLNIFIWQHNMFIIKFSLTVYPFNNPKYNGVTGFLVHVGKLVHEIYIMGMLIDVVIFVWFFGIWI